jgi:hypothetical protein
MVSEGFELTHETRGGSGGVPCAAVDLVLPEAFELALELVVAVGLCRGKGLSASSM